MGFSSSPRSLLEQVRAGSRGALDQLFTRIQVGAQNRSQFLALAGQLTRRVLINYGQGQRADKRGGPKSRASTQIFTTQTAVQLFPGRLTSGNNYVMNVRAISAPNDTFSSKPLIGSFPWPTADSLSGLPTAP